MFKKLGFVLLMLILLLSGFLILMNRNQVLEYWETLIGIQDTREVVARVQSIEGSPKFRLPKKLVYRDLALADNLRYYDTITTDEKSRVTLSFLSGLVLELEPNSILVLEKPAQGQSGEVVISFLKGNFNVLRKGEAGRVVLTKGDSAVDVSGRKNEALKIEQQDLLVDDIPEPSPSPSPIIAPTPLPVIIATPTPEPIQKPKKLGLSDEYIASIVKKQKPFFNRCYAQHLRLNPNASGRISMTFTIKNNGEVHNVKVLKSSISDPRLQKCTLGVMERMQFKNFEGEPIVVNYPINFE